eukprot:CAMPEP_0173122580 /NCGR_PEP_ID=MMETSP1102-20130122/54273_1 /TAXON_ID=49646 /ORGANISM="Geminigera sp., Strain Caron Lab Isolate" /LENGTH=399 /DNA_ID=CAMNT_0014030019 /DNA_START=30 /DNA_END=1229 /DNA_ORIENTATION=+
MARVGALAAISLAIVLGISADASIPSASANLRLRGGGMPSFLSGTSGKPGSVVNAKAAPMPDWYKGAAPSNGLINFVGSTVMPALVALGVSAMAGNVGGGKSGGGQITVEQVRQARDMWISSVQRLSVAETVALYDTQNVRLLGTVDTEDNKLRNSHKLIHEYFTHFLAHDQIVAHFPEVTEDSMIRLGKHHVIYSGYYTFELTKDGVTKAAKAKFSYLYVRKNGHNNLLITTHNSGITPQGVTVVAKKRFGGAPPPPPISVEEVAAARDAWINSVQQLDVDATTLLYDTENVRLLGTVDTEDNKLRNNHALIHEYFTHFLSNDKIVAKFPEVTEDNIIQLGPNHVIFSDYYTFELTKHGKTRMAKAKFSYVYRRKTGHQGLLIATHNSGITPEGIIEM